MSDQILTAKEIAAKMKCSDETVRRYHKQGLLPGSWQAKKGSPVKMSAAALERLMKGRE